MIDPDVATTERRTALILTAEVGAGHTAMGHAIRAECDRMGSQTVLLDGVEEVSPLLARLLAWSYAVLAHFAPPLCGLGFTIITKRFISTGIQLFMGLLIRKRLSQIVSSIAPDIVISTYPFLTSTLGLLRRSGDLQTPVVAVIADYGAHPLWVSADIDLHLVPCPDSAQMVENAGGRALVARLPVSPAFQNGTTRGEARMRLDLGQDAFIVLIVGGSLGIGDLVRTTECVVAAGAFALVVTGRNERLYDALMKRFGQDENARITKWTSEMSLFMDASDCMVQSTQGMTIVEAMESGLPIVTFGPLPGHGKLNAQVMEKAGVAPWVRSADELKRLIEAAVAGTTVLPPPSEHHFHPSFMSVLSGLYEKAAVPAVAPARDIP